LPPKIYKKIAPKLAQKNFLDIKSVPSFV